MPAGENDGREYSRFYFSADTDPKCFVGSLNDDDQMSVTEVSDYIKYNKPELFKKLNGLPIQSTDLVCFNTGHPVGQSDSTPTRDREPSRPMNQARYNVRPLRERYDDAQLSTPFAHTIQLLKSTRARIEQKLGYGYSLYRRRYNLRGGVPACSLRICTNRVTDTHSGEMIVLEHDLVTNTNYMTNVTAQNEFFCGQCFQRISSFNFSRCTETGRETNRALYFDGVDHRVVDHCTVLDSASRLYSPTDLPPTIKLSTITDAKGYEDHAFNYPSNSPRAKLLRARVQEDINKTLAEVVKYEKAQQNELENKNDTTHNSLEVNLLITRPYYMEPKDQRYKKQGLTSHDYIKDLKLRKESIDRKIETHSPTPMPVLSPLKTIFRGDRICSCREPDNGTENLRCSAELCPIGWFHLHCTGLDRMPTIAEKFYCEYCRTTSGESEIDSLRITSSRHSSVDPDTYSPVRSHFAGTTHQNYYQEYIANWSVVNRAQYELEHSLERSIEHTSAKSIDSHEDDGYLASDEFESTEIDSGRYDPTNQIPTRTSTPQSHEKRCMTPKPTQPASPRTPQVAGTPKYVSSKPWGTPVNVNTPSMTRSFDVSAPLSPSPTKKRKLGQIENDMREIDLDLTDNEEDSDGNEEEEGELVPFMLEC